MSKRIYIVVIALSALILGGCSSGIPSELGSGVTNTSATCDLSANEYGLSVGTNPEKPFPMVDKIEGHEKQVSYKYMAEERNADGTPVMKDGKPVEVEKVAGNIKYYGVGLAFISNGKLNEGSGDCADNHIHSVKEIKDSDNKINISASKCTETLPYSSISAPAESLFLKMNFRNMPLDIKSTADSKELVDWISTIEKNGMPDVKLKAANADIYDVLFVPNKDLTKSCAEKGVVFDVLISENAKADYLEKNRAPRGTVTYYSSDGTQKDYNGKMSLKEILELCQNNLTSVLGEFKPETINLGENSGSTSTSKTSTSKAPPNAITNGAVLDAVGLDKSKQYLQLLAGDVAVHDGSPPEANAAILAKLRQIEAFKNASGLKVNKGASTTSISFNLNGNNVTYVAADAHNTITNPDCAPSTGTNNDPTINVCNATVETHSSVGEDPWCGFTPECKPAIYLYPTKETTINVKIGPEIGIRTITIPAYDSINGWSVIANKQGNIFLGNQRYSHLFYEALTPTPKIPKTGWIADGKHLWRDLFVIAKKSQLNTKEAKEFSNYWTEKLDESEYYFVGWVNRDEIDAIEPLNISPKPETLWRVRYFFIPLQSKMDIAQPNINKLQRNGYTAVEWGGWSVKN